MNVRIYVAALPLIALPLFAQQRAAWEWDEESRIAARVEAARRAPKTTEGPSAMGVAVNGHAFTPGYRIDGAANPELFLPSELMTRVLMGLDRDPKIRAERRATLRDGIHAQGWQEEEFWKVMESIGAEHAALNAKANDIDYQTQKASPPERRELEAKSAGLQRPICAARVKALALARERFDRIAFDRFLYSAVAPKIVRFTSGSVDPAWLRYLEGGCR